MLANVGVKLVTAIYLIFFFCVLGPPVFMPKLVVGLKGESFGRIDFGESYLSHVSTLQAEYEVEAGEQGRERR